MDLILANGQIVTAHESYHTDIGIEGGVIKQIGHGLGPAGRTVDCNGKILFPGGVDVHTHVEFEWMGHSTADDFHSSTVQAACGGITTICDYAFPEPGQSLQDCPRPLEPARREVGNRLSAFTRRSSSRASIRSVRDAGLPSPTAIPASRSS